MKISIVRTSDEEVIYTADLPKGETLASLQEALKNGYRARPFQPGDEISVDEFGAYKTPHKSATSLEIAMLFG